jgi:hypothetical protein
VRQPELERQAKRLAAPSLRFFALAFILGAPGIVLIAVTSGWPRALGIVLVAIALMPLAVGLASVLSAGVARWAARDRPFPNPRPDRRRRPTAARLS